mmetsp:Transcript_5542/g.7220  ORF Transcript_5542/g.7220 Transcript_5542/m.7220 type:complete len:118 (+) Transcript_5542:69-422(+)
MQKEEDTSDMFDNESTAFLASLSFSTECSVETIAVQSSDLSPPSSPPQSPGRMSHDVLVRTDTAELQTAGCACMDKEEFRRMYLSVLFCGMNEVLDCDDSHDDMVSSKKKLDSSIAM